MSDERIQALDILTRGNVAYNGKAYTVIEAFDRALEDLTYKVAKYRKKGKLILEVEIDPGSSNHMSIKPSVKIAEPKPIALTMLGYVDASGRLYSDDPDQMKLAISNVESMSPKGPEKIDVSAVEG